MIWLYTSSMRRRPTIMDRILRGSGKRARYCSGYPAGDAAVGAAGL